jgi:two-component system OmpR family response regulator
VSTATGAIEAVAASARVNRVLVIDEEEQLTNLLDIALTFEGWQVEVLGGGTNAVEVARRFRPDAILLDMMLPDVNGVQVVAQLRAGGIAAPVIFLTGRNSLEDRLAAFGAGGDDYMTKPFALQEVIARLRAVFRRSGLAATSIVVADVVIDETTRQVWRADIPVWLSVLEFDVLRVLVDRAGVPIDGTGVAALLPGPRASDLAIARAIEGLRHKVNQDATPFVHVADGRAWLEPTAG